MYSVYFLCSQAYVQCILLMFLAMAVDKQYL